MYDIPERLWQVTIMCVVYVYDALYPWVEDEQAI